MYRRSATRVKRRSGEELVAKGAAIVTNVYPEGLTWYDSSETASVWAEIRAKLVEGKPPPVHDLQWVGHVWESDTDAVLLYFDGAH